MLIVYLDQFTWPQIQQLELWRQRNLVAYWPRSRGYSLIYDCSICTDWWLLFSRLAESDLWLLQYSEHSRIVASLD